MILKSNTIPDSKSILDFQNKIFSFYEKRGRHDLPWRKTTNKYFILVSEIMLQQTQVDRVIPKYLEWIKRFKTPCALAAAPLKDVLATWSGLGYNSRAKRLQDSARIICDEYKGIVPSNPEELLLLSGVGPYTARSVLIFADNAFLATVDTNIRRILIHDFSLDEKISDKELFLLAKKILPRNKSRDWHNALMDYGATFLTARRSGIKSVSKQSKFSGSRREVRGEIIRQLLQGEKFISELEKLSDIHNVKDILFELKKEGLISINDKEKLVKIL